MNKSCKAKFRMRRRRRKEEEEGSLRAETKKKNNFNSVPLFEYSKRRDRLFRYLMVSFFKKMGQSQLLFVYFQSFQTNNTILTANQCEYIMPIQYLVLGFEPTTFWTCVVNHKTRAPAQHNGKFINGGSPGRVVLGGNSYPKGGEFESRILGGYLLIF